MRYGTVKGRNEGAWPRRASRTYLMVRWVRRRMLYARKTRNGVMEVDRMVADLMN